MQTIEYNYQVFGRWWKSILAIMDNTAGLGVHGLCRAAAVLGNADQLLNAPKTAEQLATTVGSDANRLHRALRLLSGTLSPSRKQAISVDANHRMSALEYTSILLACSFRQRTHPTEIMGIRAGYSPGACGIARGDIDALVYAATRSSGIAAINDQGDHR